MSLLDVSLATSQELARRPLMERVLGPGGIDESRRPLVQEGSHPYRHTDRGTPPSYSWSPWSDKRWRDTRCGEELQGLAALHRRSAVSCD